MPNYQYICKDCNFEFEKWISYEDDPHNVNCPNCKKKNIKKIISSFPIHYKGSGFYTTDKES